MALTSTSEYWTHTRGPATRANRAFRPVAAALVRSAWRIRVHGTDRVPHTGPVILAANHTSVLDGPLLYAISRRPVHALVKQEMFTGPLNWGLRTIGQISVDRYCVDPAAVKACLAVLHRGDVVAIYPEGFRGRGDFDQVKPGVAYLAMCTGAPIIPVAALGVRTDGQSVGTLPRLRSTIDIVFGPRIDTETAAWPRRQHLVRERTQHVATALRSHLQYARDLTGQHLPAAGPSPS